MPRKPQVNYYPSRNAYFTNVDRKPHRLAVGPDDAPNGPTYLAALKAFSTLMEQGTLDTAGDENSVRTIFNAYLTAREGKCRENTWKIKMAMLPRFVEKCGDMPCSKVKPYHAEQVMSEQKGWNDGTRWIFLRSVKAAFAWAVKNELIARNPLNAVEMPSVKSKSRERIITAEEHAKVLSNLSRKYQQPLRHIIVALENTGARPNELTEAKVSDFNDKIGALEYFPDNLRRENEHGHKTSRKGNHRVIYFTGSCLDMVKDLCASKKLTDYIFTSSKGTKYRPQKIKCLLWVIGQRLGLKGYCPYTYRHTFATNWLAAGRSIEMLATLMGNSAEVIRKNYSHLIHEHETLRSQLEEFRQSQLGAERQVIPLRQAK